MIRRRRAASLLLLAAGAGVVASLVLLGNWQLRRLAWKSELIEVIETRAFGDAVAVPHPYFDPLAHEYRRVGLDGTYLHEQSRFVKAVTALGPGYWVLTPLQTPRRTVWVNRGFVSPERRASGRYATPEGRVRAVGLVRITEPGGTLLQSNDPSAGRWYSRDTAALSLDAGLAAEPDWFIDAALDEDAAAARWPRAGLTRLDFRNPHLSYALTWYAMAFALACGIGYVCWLERNRARARHVRDARPARFE